MTIRECYDELGLDFDETFNTSTLMSPSKFLIIF